MNNEKLLEAYNKLQKKHESTYKKYKSFQSGYKKSQKKLSDFNKMNQELKKKLQKVKDVTSLEIKKYKMIAQKYKKSGLDFLTKKRVLELQQTVNSQEELLFRFREKIKDQKKVIQTFNSQTKLIRQENIDIKNVLNNIQSQISNFLPSSSVASSVSDVELTKTILKSTEPTKPTKLIIKEEPIIKQPKEEPIIKKESIMLESDSEEEIEEDTDSEVESSDDESAVDTGFLSD